MRRKKRCSPVLEVFQNNRKCQAQPPCLRKAMLRQPANQVEAARPQVGKNLSMETHRAHSRLLRECEAFRVELGFLERRSSRPDNFWAVAAHEQLNNVLRCLESDDIEGGWYGLHAAQRYAVFGMNQIELANRAHVLREESLKINSWRAEAMESLLSGPEDHLSAENVADAIALRNEDFSHQHFKAAIIGRPPSRPFGNRAHWRRLPQRHSSSFPDACLSSLLCCSLACSDPQFARHSH